MASAGTNSSLSLRERAGVRGSGGRIYPGEQCFSGQSAFAPASNRQSFSVASSIA
jgi:hypothetical protein